MEITTETQRTQSPQERIVESQMIQHFYVESPPMITGDSRGIKPMIQHFYVESPPLIRGI